MHIYVVFSFSVKNAKSYVNSIILCFLLNKNLLNSVGYRKVFYVSIKHFVSFRLVFRT